jgi:prepilin-type N-terminal cleavage/methylation domain-containing protein
MLFHRTGLPLGAATNPSGTAPQTETGGPGSAPGRAGARPQARAGFTLLELLIAMMFLSVGILALAQVFAVAQRHAAHSREETVAVALVQEIREKIMSETFADVQSIFSGVDTHAPSSISLPASEWAQHLNQRLGSTARGTITVVSHNENADLPTGLLDVQIAVSWREESHTITFPMRFMIAKMGG